MSMRCVDSVLIENGGTKYVRATIFADTTPATMPTTGAGIFGLNADDHLFADSVLYAEDSGDVYMLNGAGTWVKQ